MTLKYTAVLFDLDGTITDSGPQIIETVAIVLEQLGRKPLSEEQRKKFIGPPLEEGFMLHADMNQAEAKEATALYRKIYRQGMFDTPIFDGIEELLEELSRQVPLAIATSKLESLATEILQHYGLAHYFQVISGGLADKSRGSKSSVIAHALKQLAAGGHDTTRTIILGDRFHDIEGAIANGIDSIGCTWAGYGQLSEFDRATFVANHPSEVMQLLAK